MYITNYSDPSWQRVQTVKVRARRGMGEVTMVPDVAADEVAWRRRMLAAQEATVAEQARWREQDKTARIAQISATLLIPVAAAVWRWILNRNTRVGVGD
jgi:hypothetical protein